MTDTSGRSGAGTEPRGPRLTGEERAMAAGEAGEAVASAMRIVLGAARASGAARLLPVESAHIDSCLYHGVAGLDFAERLVRLGGRTAVPATLNVGSLDLLHPGLARPAGQDAAGARRLMDAYTALGCTPTWTCAPYQLDHRPSAGTHVAWAESNAIAFVNSVLGARTDRYGDFLDISAALTGRVPEAGLHLTANRRARVVIDCAGVSRALLSEDAAWGALGIVVGALAGIRVPALTGLPDDVDEDRLKALGAAGASAGGVALFHVVGVTPEAPTLAAALRGGLPEARHTVTTTMLREARDLVSTPEGARVDAVCLGTPHFSLTEFERLAGLLRGRAAFDRGTTVYVATSRSVLAAARERGLAQECERAGAVIVTDTCTYVTPILDPGTRVVMTNSGKWAWYAPANIGVDAVLGSLGECVSSARAGEVRRDESLWR
ncbi:aconitase X [Streptomyces sp. NPDC051217]|uniref:aconitase X n=1 Tax=Streptomyces sp. NPDC051217 TaxID=3365644 RepID=UPI0037A4E4D9